MMDQVKTDQLSAGSLNAGSIRDKRRARVDLRAFCIATAYNPPPTAYFSRHLLEDFFTHLFVAVLFGS